jgi:hypothetical protein
MRTQARLVLSLLWLAPAGAAAQVPAGPEFQVNVFTTGPQSYPSVAADADGRFVVAWQSLGQDGSNEGVWARRFDSTATPFAGEFQVNAHTTGAQRAADVASDANGNTIIVWEDLSGQDGSGFGVYARRYDSTGAPGPEFRVNSHTTQSQSEPSVASGAGGNVVVAWTDNRNPDLDVFAKVYDNAGNPLGPDFPVNSFTTGNQRKPSVAMDATGNFVVVWMSVGQDGSGSGIFGQRFDAAGALRGSEFRVNSYTTNNQQYPSVALEVSGRFVVAWSSYGQISSDDVLAQRFDAAGSPLGTEFLVNTFTTEAQGRPAVNTGPSGDFTVAWTSLGPDASLFGVAARRYNHTGTPYGPEFQVNSYTTSIQGVPSVGADGNGQFVVTWTSTSQDGQAAGIFGQRFLSDVIFKDGFDPNS